MAERGDGSGFGIATNEASPDPVPPGELVVSQPGALLTGVQLHDAGVKTPTDPAPPAAGTLPPGDCSAYVHACPAWVTVTSWPPIENDALRGVVPGLAAIAMLTEPLPEDAFGCPVAQLALLVTTQPQLSPLVITPIVPTPPPAPNGLPSSEVSSVTLHAAAPCEMVSVWPPTTIDPDRGVVAEFGSTMKWSMPGPVREPPESTVTQLGAEVVAYPHVAPVVTDVEPTPPVSVKDASDEPSATVQSMPACVTVSVCPAMVAVS